MINVAEFSTQDRRLISSKIGVALEQKAGSWRTMRAGTIELGALILERLRTAAVFNSGEPAVAAHFRRVFDATPWCRIPPDLELGNVNPPDYPATLTIFLMSLRSESPMIRASYGNGCVFHNIAARNNGPLQDLSRRTLGPHTDLPHGYLPTESAATSNLMAPKTAYLTCIQSDGHTATKVASIDAVLARLTAQEVSLLSEQAFICNAPTADSEGTVTETRACIVEHNGARYARLSPNLIRSTISKHQLALDRMLSEAEYVMEDIVLEAGDILLIDNWRACHGRASPTTEAAEDSTRWLLRSYGVPL